MAITKAQAKATAKYKAKHPEAARQEHHGHPKQRAALANGFAQNVGQESEAPKKCV